MYKPFSTIILLSVIVFWPILMTKVAWDTASCEYPPKQTDRKCISAWFFHAVVFSAPIVWLSIGLFLIVRLRLVIFEERRLTPEYIRDLLIEYMRQRQDINGNLHED